MAGVWKPSEMFCCWLRKARIFPKKTSMDVYCHQIKKRGKCFNPNRFKVCLKNIAWSAVTRLLFECSWYKSTLFSYYKFTSNVRRCYVVVKLVHDRCVFNYMLSCWFSQLYLKLWYSAWAYTKLTNLLICFPLQISLFRFGSFPCKCWTGRSVVVDHYLAQPNFFLVHMVEVLCLDVEFRMDSFYPLFTRSPDPCAIFLKVNKRGLLTCGAWTLWTYEETHGEWNLAGRI